MREIKFRAWMMAEMHYDLITINPEACKKAGYELMQYTGLKDKNGVEIYEGDIVEWVGNKETVSYDNQYCMFNTETSCMDEIMEVIGNIYENPELLEDK